MSEYKTLTGFADLWIMDIPNESEGVAQLEPNYTPVFRANAIMRAQTNNLDSNTPYHIEPTLKGVESLFYTTENYISCKLLGFDTGITAEAFDALAASLNPCQVHDSSRTNSETKCEPFSKRVEEIKPGCCFGGLEEVPRFYNIIFIIPRNLFGSEVGSAKPVLVKGNSSPNQIPCSCTEASRLPVWITKWLDCQRETIIVIRDVEKTMGCGDAWSLNHHSCTHEYPVNVSGLPLEDFKDGSTSSQPHRKFKFETTNLKTGYSALLHLKKYFGVDLIQKFTAAFERGLADNELTDFLSTLLICVGSIELSL